jgi:UDP-glucose 4-epimerase
MKKILILGSEGFIGKHLVYYFKKTGWDVSGYDLQIVDSAGCSYHFIQKDDSAENLFSGNNFNVCINAAGYGSIPFSIADPVADFAANSYDTIIFLEGIRTFNPTCKYLHISSAAVYGNPPNLPIKESGQLKPLSPYGWHKLISEEICREYHSLYGLNIIITRPFSVYGPGLKKQLFWDLYQKSLLPDREIELWGTGNESRDFIYIDDFVRAFGILINHCVDSFSVFNIASGVETTIKEVSENFFRLLCPNKNIYFNNRIRIGDPHNWRGDISAIKALNYNPEINIDQGIEQLIRWLKSLN